MMPHRIIMAANLVAGAPSSAPTVLLLDKASGKIRTVSLADAMTGGAGSITPVERVTGLTVNITYASIRAIDSLRRFYFAATSGVIKIYDYDFAFVADYALTNTDTRGLMAVRESDGRTIFNRGLSYQDASGGAVTALGGNLAWGIDADEANNVLLKITSTSGNRLVEISMNGGGSDATLSSTNGPSYGDHFPGHYNPESESFTAIHSNSIYEWARSGGVTSVTPSGTAGGQQNPVLRPAGYSKYLFTANNNSLKRCDLDGSNVVSVLDAAYSINDMVVATL